MGDIFGGGDKGGGKNVPFAGFNALALNDTGLTTDLLTKSDARTTVAQDLFNNDTWPYARDFMSQGQRASHDAFDMGRSIAGDDSLYKQDFIPGARSLLKQAQDYASPVRQQAEAGYAAAGSMAATEAAIKNTENKLFSFGVKPGEGTFGATRGALELGGAAQASLAASLARRGVYDEGFNRQATALNLIGEKAGPTAAANLFTAGAATGASPLNEWNKSTQNLFNQWGTTPQLISSAVASQQNAGTALNSQATAALGVNKINQQESMNLGEGIGKVAGAVAPFFI